MPKFPYTKAFVESLKRNRRLKEGKHKCVRKQVGCVRKLTGRSGQPLKRPVIVARFYECAICWREME